MKYLCSAPFSTLNIKPEGARVCCSRHAPLVQEDLKNWWNGSYLREFRKTMFSRKTLHDCCKRCLAHGASSPARYSAEFNLDLYEQESGIVKEDALDIYLFTGRACTMACVMCDSLHSLTHEKVFPERAYKNFDHNFIDPRELVGTNPNSKYIIYGGEPLIYKHFDELMEKTVPNSRETAVLTNGMHSLVRERTKGLIDQYREKVVFVFSLDGDAKTNELIRINGKTDRVLKNLNEARDRGWQCEIHYTISTLNADKFTEFVVFLKEQGLTADPRLKLNVAAVIDPIEFNPNTLPKEGKSKVLEAAKLLDIYLEEWNLEKEWQQQLELANRGVRDCLNF